ncbi:hypothetical protein CRG98_048383 [Punica granatum]|uniref:Uncharacterized protein n=1 Tax=Punica granatum TaxID=22663 RepID=A0A2I0HHY9_PUNGR|nr:hypothetical protein CRG98_048383 [Punica granatum]
MEYCIKHMTTHAGTVHKFTTGIPSFSLAGPVENVMKPSNKMQETAGEFGSRTALFFRPSMRSQKGALVRLITERHVWDMNRHLNEEDRQGSS